MFTAAHGCARIGIITQVVRHTCTPLLTVVENGLSSNCRQLSEKVFLRTLLDVVLQFQQKLGADERTRTAFLLITSDHSGVAGVAQACKSRISKPVSFLCLAPCCTVLRSRWCQSGVNIVLISAYHRNSESSQV